VGVVAVNAAWDERRNTSRTFQPAPDALPNALRALAALRANDPALVAWIEAGHPTPTEAEHVAWFGRPYKKGTR
jgi:hypothetical protein